MNSAILRIICENTSDINELCEIFNYHSVMTSKLNELEKFYQYTTNQKFSTTPSKKSRVYFKNLLNNSVIDLKMAILCQKEQITGLTFVNKIVVSDEYCKHIIRSFIVEAFSLTEHRMSEICAEKKLEIRGKNGNIHSLILEAIKIIKNTEAKAHLKKALKKVNPEFVDFKTRLLALLKDQTEENKQKWLSFFDGFPKLRNCLHDNFICKKKVLMEWKRIFRRQINFY